MEIKLLLNAFKASEIGYDIDDCYKVIDNYFLSNGLIKTGEYSYEGNDLNIFVLFILSILKTNWFYRIIDECVLVDGDFVYYDFYKKNRIDTIINLKYNFSHELLQYKNVLDCCMEKEGFENISESLFISIQSTDIMTCVNSCIKSLKEINKYLELDSWMNLVESITLSFSYHDNQMDYDIFKKDKIVYPLDVVPMRCPIVFLDIDGVLQPLSARKRFGIDRKELRKEIAKEYNDDAYLSMDEYDIAAVYLDWEKTAVENLKKLLKRHSAKIVISSAWKEGRTFEELLKLFKLHDLDKDVIDIVNYTTLNHCEPLIEIRKDDKIKICQTYGIDKKDIYYGRVYEIFKYLCDHQEIKKYVILDDLDLNVMGLRFLYIDGYERHNYYFDDEYFEMADLILDEPNEIPKFKNIIFLDIDGVISPDIFSFEREMSKGMKQLYETYNKEEFLDKYFYTFQTVCPKARGKYDEYESYYQNRVEELKKDDIHVKAYDLYLVETSWSLDAVNQLKKLLDETESKIVIESSWATYDQKRMKYLLSLVGLDDYYVGNAIGYNKNDGINKFLKLHREIESFVIIDDEDYWEFSKVFGGRLIRPVVSLSHNDCLLAKNILQNYIKVSAYKSLHDNDINICFEYEIDKMSKGYIKKSFIYINCLHFYAKEIKDNDELYLFIDFDLGYHRGFFVKNIIYIYYMIFELEKLFYNQYDHFIFAINNTVIDQLQDYFGYKKIIRENFQLGDVVFSADKSYIVID